MKQGGYGWAGGRVAERSERALGVQEEEGPFGSRSWHGWMEEAGRALQGEILDQLAARLVEGQLEGKPSTGLGALAQD